MAILECAALHPPIRDKTTGSLAMLSLVVAVIIATAADSPSVRAESAAPVVPAVKLVPHSSKSPHAVAEPANLPQKTAAKSNPRPLVTRKPAKPAPAPAAKAAPVPAAKPTPVPAAKPTPVPAAKPTQVMEFDADQVEGQRLEPGYDLIQASPRRARHPSLVSFPPKPEDSVVKGN